MTAATAITRYWRLAARGRRLPKFAATAGLLLALLATGANGEEGIWRVLQQGGTIVLMRHAATDSRGDPLLLNPDDCSVERNLSAQGRDVAKRVGNAFREHSVPIAEVLSSRYCRTRDTARLAFGRVRPWRSLDLIVVLPKREAEARTAEVAARIAGHAGLGNLVMVSHWPNIRAIAGERIPSGAFLVLKPDGAGSFKIIGRFAPADLTAN